METKNTNTLSSEGMITLIMGDPGAGKTQLISTLESPIVLATEPGLLPLRNHNIPYIDIRSYKDMINVYNWLANDKSGNYKSIVIDSITALSNIIFEEERLVNLSKPNPNPNSMVLYSETQEKIMKIVNNFALLKYRYHLIYTATIKESEDIDNTTKYMPALRGNACPIWVASQVDLLLALKVDSKYNRYLSCKPDNRWKLKDRTSALAEIEPPHLSKIYEKIRLSAGGNDDQQSS
jgi:hypothetical protein